MARDTPVPQWFTYFATQLCEAAACWGDYLHVAIGRPGAPGLPAPPESSKWLGFYRDHRAVFDEFGRIFGLTDVRASDAMAMVSSDRPTAAEVTTEVESLSADEMKEIAEGWELIAFPPSVEWVRDRLNELDADAEDDESEDGRALNAAIESEAGSFLFRVWMPCWFLYREYPPRLLRRARCGDDDALEKLLRLDKSIIRDPGIANRIHVISHTGNKRERDRLDSALSGRPIACITEKAIRMGIAGLLTQISAAFTFRITTPQIRVLFDRIASVRNGTGIDSSLPKSGEAMLKAVQRNRNFPMSRRA